MPGNKYDLSIVVLTCDREKKLERCLTSLFHQDVPAERFEIMVVVDGSKDGTTQLLKKLKGKAPNLKFIYQQRSGISVARNRGILHSSAPLIVFVADDYVLPPHYAQTILRFFEENPGAKIVRFKVDTPLTDLTSKGGGLFYRFSFQLRLLPELNFKGPFSQFKKALSKLPPEERKITTRHILAPSGGAAFKREVFESIAPFSEHLKRSEDTEIRDRLIRAGIPIYYYPHLVIPHDLGSLWQFVKKQFYTGFQNGIYKFLAEKKRNKASQKAQAFPRLLWGKAKTVSLFAEKCILGPVWRARQADSFSEALCYLPLMCLFYWVYQSGYIIGKFIFNEYKNERTSEALLFASTLPSRILLRSRKTRKFFIYASEGTESELLSEFLRQHPHVCYLGEPLNQKQRAFPWLYINSLLSLRRRDSSVKAGGFKFLNNITTANSSCVKEGPAFFQRLVRNGWDPIYLRRRNLLKQLLSDWIAQGRYESPGKIARSLRSAKIQVDCNWLLKKLPLTERAAQEDLQLVSGVFSRVDIIYENDLLHQEQHQRTADRVFDFLGLERIPLTAWTLKSPPQRLEEWIENYEELRDQLLSTPYARYLDETVTADKILAPL